MDLQILQVIRVLGIAVLSFLVALGLTPTLTKLLEKYQMHKQIRTSEAAPIFSQLHQKKAGTPTGGGVIIWVTVLGLAFIFWALNLFFDQFWGYLNFVDRAQTYLPIAAMLIAAVLGLFDDILGIMRIGPRGGGLMVRHKILLYLVIALIGAGWFFYRLDWDVIYLPFMGYYNINWWYIPFFMFIITASAFSVNETDGLDGLAGGVLLFAFAALTVVAFVINRYDLATFSGAIVGALLAFLWFNIYPARFFMGDTGSMALGITLGTIAMLTNTALILPFFAAIPVIESLSVIVQITNKKLFGRKIFLSTPIHHHFEALGWKESQIVMRFWIISAIFTTLGLVIFFSSRFFT